MVEPLEELIVISICLKLSASIKSTNLLRIIDFDLGSTKLAKYPICSGFVFIMRLEPIVPPLINIQ